MRIRSRYAAVLALFLASCGYWTNPETPSVPVTTIPTTLAPPPTTTPAALSCRPSNVAPTCGVGHATFQADVDRALELLVQRRPDIFDLRDALGTNAYRVVKVQDYINGAVANVQARGLCAHWNGEELAVKDPGNSVDDAYDILTGGSYMWRGPGSYMGNCVPASW